MIARSLFDFPGLGWRSAFAEMERMRREMDRLTHGTAARSGLSGFHAGVFPTINLTEDKDNYYIRAELPGLAAGDLDIQTAGNNITISGERKITAEEGVKYHRKEREGGKFSRVINLPEIVNMEKVSATLVNGMLTLTIPKAEAAKPRQIVIQ